MVENTENTQNPGSVDAGHVKLPDNRNAEQHRVGIEIEFGGLSAAEAAHIVRQSVGGDLIQLDAHKFKVCGTQLGDLRIELDSKYVHSPDGASGLERKMRELAGDLGNAIVPTELVTGPLPVSRIAAVDDLARQLAAAGAVGTQQPHLACGLHLNIEHTGTEVTPILRILQAFLLSVPGLRRAIELDRMRTWLPFIARFPKEFEAKVLDPDYAPDFETFVKDYCAANPEKNRELDLVPLLASIDERAVETALGHPAKAVRPAFHYRLPNACLGDADWSIETEWKRWLSVEALAADEIKLRAGLKAWRKKNTRSVWSAPFEKLYRKVVPQ